MGAAFIAIVFILSFIANFLFVREKDEVTVFERVSCERSLRG